MATTINIGNVPAGRIKSSLLQEELIVAGLNPTFTVSQGPGYCDGVFEEDDVPALQAVLNVHDPEAPTSDELDTVALRVQRLDAASLVMPHLKALRALPVLDAAYSLLARMGA